MAILYRRQVAVEVGLAGGAAKRWEDLRVSFSVAKGTGRTPNKLTCDAYNLSRASSNAFNEPAAVVRLFAGYGAPQAIFLGDVDRAIRSRNGNDIITRIEGSDGGRKFRDSRISKSFSAEITVEAAIRELASAAGISFGSLGSIPDVRIGEGTTLDGPVRDELDRLTDMIGAEWSLQDGELQILAPSETTTEASVLLSPDSGLIGSPVPTDKGLELVSLLQPKLAPGRRFQLRSRHFNGVYKVKQVEHVGDSGWAQEFYSKVVAREVQ